MRVSLNEIQTITYKACIAVGLPIGISQDASQAAGHVYPQYQGSMKPFADAVSAVDKKYSDKYNITQAVEGIFSSITTGKQLSALYAAPTVCDQILVRNNNSQAHSLITLIELDVPVIIIFEIMFTTMFIRNGVSITWSINQGDKMQGACVSGNIIFTRGNYEDLFSLRKSKLTISIPNYISSLSFLNANNTDKLLNLDIDNMTWKCLSEYADRLLVPSSDASRMKGAGAGTIDTD